MCMSKASSKVVGPSFSQPLPTQDHCRLKKKTQDHALWTVLTNLKLKSEGVAKAQYLSNSVKKSQLPKPLRNRGLSLSALPCWVVRWPHWFSSDKNVYIIISLALSYFEFMMPCPISLCCCLPNVKTLSCVNRFTVLFFTDVKVISNKSDISHHLKLIAS